MNSGSPLKRFVFLEFGFLFLIAGGSVFFGAVHPWAHMTGYAILFFLVLCYPNAWYGQRSLSQPLGWVLGAVFLFLFLQYFSLSLNPYATGVEILKWLAMMSCFFLVQLLPCASVRRLLLFLVCLAALEALYGIYQVWSGLEQVLWREKEAYRGFVTGTFVNRNHFAGFLEMALPVHLGLLLEAVIRRRPLMVLLLGFLLPVSLAGLVFSGSRMGLLSLFVAVLGGSGLLLKHLGKKGFLFLGVLATLAALALFLGWDILLKRFELYQGHLAQGSGRLMVWLDSLELLRDYPWQGIGLGGFRWIFPSYQSGELLLGWAHAHQDYLELAIELGLPCFVLVVTGVGFLIGRAWNRLSLLELPDFAAGWGLLVGVTALVLHGFADFNFAIPINLFLFVLLLGSVRNLTERDASKESRAF